MNHRGFLNVVFIVVIAMVVFVARRGQADAPPDHYTMMNGIVTDTKTKLKWEQSPVDMTYTWDDAKAHCMSLGVDWHVPTMKELQTIVDETTTNPAIDATAFPKTQSDVFWTSSPRQQMATDAWVVQFYFGKASYVDKATAGRVRCVR